MPDKSDSADCTSHEELANLIGTGLLAEARPLCVKNCEHAPDDPENWLILAAIDEQLVLDQGVWDFASHALRLDDGLAEASLMLSRISWKWGEIEAALENSQKAINADPDYVHARLQFAQQLLKLGRVQEAILHLIQGYKQEPVNAELLALLVYALIEKEDYIQAGEFLQQLTALPDRYELDAVLEGHLKRLTGDSKLATDAYKKAIARGNLDTEAGYWLSRLTGSHDSSICERFNMKNFDGFAPVYLSRDFHQRHDTLKTCIDDLLKEHIGEPENKYDILDIGCGTGITATILKPYAHSLVGLDYAPAMIDIASKTKLYDLLVCDDASKILPLFERHFDIILMLDFLPFSGKAESILGTLNKIIKTNGLLLLSISDSPEFASNLPHFHYFENDNKKIISTLSRNGWKVLNKINYKEHHIDVGAIGSQLYALQNIKNCNKESLQNKLRPVLIEENKRLSGLKSLQEAIVLTGKKDFPAAQNKLDEAADVNPDSIDVWLQYGNLELTRGQFADAIRYYKKCLRLIDRNAQVWFQLGVAYQQKLEKIKAIECYKRSIEINPGLLIAYANLAYLLNEQGSSEQLSSLIEKLLSIDPDDSLNITAAGAESHKKSPPIELISGNLVLTQVDEKNFSYLSKQAMAYIDRGMLEKSHQLLLALIKHRPEDTGIKIQLAFCLKKKGKYKQALDIIDSIQDKKQIPISGLETRAGILAARGLASEAYIAWEKASKDAPPEHLVHSNRLFMYNYSHQAERDQIAKAHVSWGQVLEQRFPISQEVSTRDPDYSGRLRIGYVSADFREHSVARFLLPVMESHDHRKFEIFCYANNENEDSATTKFRYFADAWRNIYAIDDEQVCTMIRRDEIDILVDLSGHTGGNRLTLFARKPAKLQITYLGYPNTTGLSRIDYRITDKWADPVDQPAELNSEKLLRLPHSFLCYAPPEMAPAVQWSQDPGTKRFTFACFNNLYKVTPHVVKVWSELLTALPGSSLLLKSFSFESDETFNHYQNLFSEHGISPERIHLMSSLDSQDHYSMYQHVDIALDPFPYNGTTTTCEALWMGLPVITKIGDRHAARVGFSLLANIGMEEFAAASDEEYVDIAISLASDRERLVKIKLSLRDRLRESSLMNHKDFTRSLEQAYKSICKKQMNRVGPT